MTNTAFTVSPLHKLSHFEKVLHLPPRLAAPGSIRFHKKLPPLCRTLLRQPLPSSRKQDLLLDTLASPQSDKLAGFQEVLYLPALLAAPGSIRFDKKLQPLANPFLHPASKTCSLTHLPVLSLTSLRAFRKFCIFLPFWLLLEAFALTKSCSHFAEHCFANPFT